MLTPCLPAGSRPDEETALPAGATAAQLREWADRMLRRRAADAAQEGVASSIGAGAAPGNMPAQAGVSAQLKVRLSLLVMVLPVLTAGGCPSLCPTSSTRPCMQGDELPPGLSTSTLEEPEQGAQAPAATGDGGAAAQQAAEEAGAKPDVSAWRRFIDERMGAQCSGFYTLRFHAGESRRNEVGCQLQEFPTFRLSIFLANREYAMCCRRRQLGRNRGGEHLAA